MACYRAFQRYITVALRCSCSSMISGYFSWLSSSLRIEAQVPLPEVEGRRNVSAGLLSPPSSTSSPSRLLCSNYTPSATADPTITISAKFYSAASYEFLGFDTERVRSLHSSCPPAREMFDWAVDWCTSMCEDIADTEDDWEFAMKQAGISQEGRFDRSDTTHLISGDRFHGFRRASSLTLVLGRKALLRHHHR